MNKPRILGTTMLVLVVLLSATSLVYALASGPADEDAAVYASQPTTVFNGITIRVEAGEPTCIPARWSFLKWNLADIPDGATLGYAKLVLTTSSVQVTTGVAAQIELYRVNDDSWQETTLTANNDPAFGTLIQSVPIPAAAGDIITFDNSQLLGFLQQEADGDNVASFGLRLAGNCGNGSVLVAMHSKDAAVADAQKPTLDARLGGPNSVTLTDSSAQQTNSLPLYGGLGALALIAVAGVGVSRRRMAAR